MQDDYYRFQISPSPPFSALRYPHQDCLQCLGIKSSMRECWKSKYKNCRFLPAVPFDRRQSGYAVAAVRRRMCWSTFWANREVRDSSIWASCLNMSRLLALVADTLRRRFRRAVTAQMSLLATCSCQSELEDASESGWTYNYSISGLGCSHGTCGHSLRKNSRFDLDRNG